MRGGGSGMRRAGSFVTIGEMSSAGRHIIEEFDALADSEKREVLMRLLEISREMDVPSASDEEMISAADAVFLEYDRAEAAE
jgi:hypothetical protein